MREYASEELPLIKIEHTNNEVRVTLRKEIAATPATENAAAQYEYETYSAYRLWAPGLDEYIVDNYDALYDRLAQDETQKIADEVRDRRDKLLEACDYLMALDYPLSTAAREQWRAYRQALRDIPQQEGFPDNIEWPQKPKDKSGQTNFLQCVAALEDAALNNIGGV